MLVEDTNWSAEAKDPFGYPYSIAMRPDQLYEHFYSLTVTAVIMSPPGRLEPKNIERSKKERQHVVFIEIRRKCTVKTRLGGQASPLCL